jgi:Domain of unknown function (DUF3127)
MELKGTALVISERYDRGQLTLRDLVIQTQEKYPQTIKIDFLGNNCDLLDKISLLDEISVSINIKGREWMDPKTNVTKYFNSIQGWKIEKIDTI